MTVWVYSGRPSEGAYFLAKQPGFKRMIKGKFFEKGDVVINWGSMGGPPNGDIVLNKPAAVKIAINKKTCFQVMSAHDIATVPWTANEAVAKEWQAQGYTIVARKSLTGHEGYGIIIVEPGDPLVKAPLYTRYIFKEKEFRVHATPQGVIDTQRKVRDPKREPTSWKVRSYKNGFIFQRKNIEPNAARDALAIATIKALGLDFGGLDIIEDKKGNFYVLEVNTAPGIEGSTVPLYAEALGKLAASASVA